MKDVVAWEFLAACRHLLTADDAHVIPGGQLLGGSIGITGRARTEKSDTKHCHKSSREELCRKWQDNAIKMYVNITKIVTKSILAFSIHLPKFEKKFDPRDKCFCYTEGKATGVLKEGMKLPELGATSSSRNCQICNMMKIIEWWQNMLSERQFIKLTVCSCCV